MNVRADLGGQAPARTLTRDDTQRDSNSFEADLDRRALIFALAVSGPFLVTATVLFYLAW